MHAAVWCPVAGTEIEARLRPAGIEVSMVNDLAGLEAVAPQMDVLVVGGHFFGAEIAHVLREKAKRLRFVQSFTAGIEGLQKQGVPPGVVVATAGDSWSPSVAEHGMALLLALVKQIPTALANQPKHHWDRSHSPRMETLSGKVAAIVGFGSIGREFAKLARPFGMRIVGLSRSASPHPLADEVQPISRLHEVLGRSDVAVIAAPYSPETHHLIDARALEAMKPGGWVINLARGGLIDSFALIDALRTGTLRGAGLDVTDPEPLPADHPLWDAPNLVLSPHVAGACGPTGRERLARHVGDNVIAFMKGEPPQFVVAL